jgi:FAD:protein FMN transferase
MSMSTLPRRAWVEQIMGMPISIHLRGPDLDSVEPAVAAVFAELRHIDAVFSPYRDDSELSRVERGELSLADANPLLAEVRALCEQALLRTHGWFDPNGLPDPRTSEPRYDPSGLVKGWAVQRAARHLASRHGYGWCLNAGGDVLVHAPADQPAWRVGIEDPRDPSRVLRAVALRTGAVATSGSAHRGGHIIDPRRGQPAGAVRAVTVIGPELLWSDVYATAMAAQGPTALAWLDRLDGYAALVVTPDGRLLASSCWPDAERA